MTHTPLTKAERGSILADCFATGYYAHEISRLCADLAAAEAERDALRGTLRRHGFQLCDIAACNCNGWHQTGGFYARFNEIDEAVGEHDGKTLLDAVKQIVSERDEAVALIDAAKSDVRPESFLEHAQAILAKCIAPYSCEQMKAVGDALAGCYRKWELMSEVALKAKDDADSMAKCKGCGGTVSDHLAPDQGGCPGSFEIDGVQMVPLAGRDNAVAQRDRAESELDAERKMRVEAEAAATRAEAESATFSRRLAEALVRNDEDDLGCDRARMEEMRDERDALKAKLLAADCREVDSEDSPRRCTDDKPCGRHLLAAQCFDARQAWSQERTEVNALKAKLADPRRVLIHETEVVATKEEIATLKARLADLSEVDEELHTCRALVNATSENLSVDLERMVDDLAEANEKAARSEKDSHSWHELYKDTKAKLAALVEAATSAETILGNMAKETGRVFGRWEINHEPLRNDAQRMLPSFRAAIAAARGGAT